MPQVVANSHQFDVELLRASRAPLANAAAPQVAALSNFGFAGTNVHILVEEQPAAAVGSAVTACRLFADDATGEERLRLGCLARTTAVVWERKAYPLSTATAARPLSAAAQLVREWERARPPPAAEMGEAQVLDAVRLVALGGVPAHARLEGDALRAPLASLGCSHAAELQILSTVNARFGTSLTLKAVDVGGGGGAGGAGGAGDSGGVPTASVASIAAEVSEHLRYARAQKSVRSEAEVRRAVQVIVLDNLPAGAELSDADCEGRTLMQLGASSMSIMQACQCQARPCHAMPHSLEAQYCSGWLRPNLSLTRPRRMRPEQMMSLVNNQFGTELTMRMVIGKGPSTVHSIATHIVAHQAQAIRPRDKQDKRDKQGGGSGARRMGNKFRRTTLRVAPPTVGSCCDATPPDDAPPCGAVRLASSTHSLTAPFLCLHAGPGVAHGGGGSGLGVPQAVAGKPNGVEPAPTAPSDMPAGSSSGSASEPQICVPSAQQFALVKTIVRNLAMAKEQTYGYCVGVSLSGAVQVMILCVMSPHPSPRPLLTVVCPLPCWCSRRTCAARSRRSSTATRRCAHTLTRTPTTR